MFEDAYPLDTYWEDNFGPVLHHGLADIEYYPPRITGTNPDCDHTDWYPNCDSCGDNGCPDCDNAKKHNHDCDRWVRMERQRRKDEINHIYQTGIVPF